MDLKKQAAAKALTYIEDKAIVGLGAGATIGHLVGLFAYKVRNGLEVTVLTSSFTTHRLLLENGFLVRSTAEFDAIDIYLDGCDQLDKNLNALKSGGGIHTHEKLLASMARQFILVGDESKYSEHFDPGYPLVIEFLPEAWLFLNASLQKMFPGAKNILRMNDKKDGPVITANDNYLLDVWFSAWPHLYTINTSVKMITGVVETSLFYNLAHQAILAGNDGIRILERGNG